MNKIYNLPFADCTTYDNKSNIIDGDLPLIPNGKYEAVFKTWFTGTLFKQPKVVLIYTITDGDYFGIDIPKYYNVKRLKNKPGNHGKFIAKPRGDLLKDFYKLLPVHPKVRFDQIPITKLGKQAIEITVGEVTKDYLQNKYADQMKYSLVREVNILKN